LSEKFKYKYKYNPKDLEPLEPKKPEPLQPNVLRCPMCWTKQRFSDQWNPDDFLQKVHLPKCEVAKKRKRQ